MEPYTSGQVASRDGTEAADVKVRILGLQRIERPFDQRDASRQGIFPLRQFQSPANPEVAKLRKHRSHVRMEVRPAIANTGIGKNESGHLVPDERAQYLPADLGRHDVHLRGHDVTLAESPHLDLQFDHLLELFDGVAGANCDDFVSHGS